jgi:tetratricopeptide (TPR) repeat protein
VSARIEGLRKPNDLGGMQGLLQKIASLPVPAHRRECAAALQRQLSRQALRSTWMGNAHTRNRQTLDQVTTQGISGSFRDMMQALLEMKEKDGRDNAFIHYIAASWQMPSLPDQQTQAPLINKVMNEGWSEEANALLPYLRSCQPMFAEIRKGAALDYAKGIGFRGYDTPVPNFLAAQIASKMLCVEGRYFQGQGKYGDALDNYLTVLTMGRDYSSPDNTLISNLISYAVVSIATRQLSKIVLSGHLDRPNLERTLRRLKEIDKTEGNTIQALAGERDCQQTTVRLMREDPEKARKAFAEALGSAESGKTQEEAQKEVEDALSHIEQLSLDLTKLWDFRCSSWRPPGGKET